MLMPKFSKKILVYSIFFIGCGLFLSGCFDFIQDFIVKEIVAISPDGKVAICLDRAGEISEVDYDTEVYITDLEGISFMDITNDELDNLGVSWSEDSRSLLYVSQGDDVWKLNLYSIETNSSIELLQEIYRISMPEFSSSARNLYYIAYMVFPDEDDILGQLNIYEREFSNIYTLMDNVYYNYVWIPGTNKIVFISVIDEFDDSFKGILMIKDVKELDEEVIFSGYFPNDTNFLGITKDGNTIVFNASKEPMDKMGIHLYDIIDEKLVEWPGPDGYEFKLPASGIKGYVLAHVKGHEDGWDSQLYLISLDKKIVRVPGWPLWIKEQKLVYIDTEDGWILVTDLDSHTTINLIEKFKEYYDILD